MARPSRWLARGAATALLAGVGYVAAAWYRYGRAGAAGDGSGQLDRFMPTSEVRERHQIRVRAPADVTFAAVRALELSQSPVIRAIFRSRELMMGSVTGDAAPARPFLEEMLALGWRVLAEVPNREIVMGAVTQPWLANPVFRGLPADEFIGFDEPDYVKIVWSMAADPSGPDDSVFRTETRVMTTDPAARRKFRRYWAVFSPGILLIRREALRLVKRAAESEQQPSARSLPAAR